MKDLRGSGFRLLGCRFAVLGLRVVWRVLLGKQSPLISMPSVA